MAWFCFSISPLPTLAFKRWYLYLLKNFLSPSFVHPQHLLCAARLPNALQAVRLYPGVVRLLHAPQPAQAVRGHHRCSLHRPLVWWEVQGVNQQARPVGGRHRSPLHQPGRHRCSLHRHLAWQQLEV